MTYRRDTKKTMAVELQSMSDFVTKKEVEEIVGAATGEIVEAIGIFSNCVDARFDKVESDVDVLKSDVATLKSDVATMKDEMSGLKFSVNRSLELSDARYLELRQQNKQLFKFVLDLTQATKASVSTAELERTFASFWGMLRKHPCSGSFSHTNHHLVPKGPYQ